MRLLLDQGIPRSTATLLRAAGWDVLHTADLDMSRATDAELLNFARDHSRTICTLDADFHAILAVSGLSSPSVIRIRREGLRGSDVAALMLRVPRATFAALEKGAMVTVTERAIRVRRLPVLR